MGSDLRYALRSLRRRPLFACVAVLTLGLGIGATTAIFSVINAVMMRPLSYDHPEQLVELVAPGPHGATEQQFSFPNVRDIRAGNRTLTAVAPFRYWLFNLNTDVGPESLLGVYVGDSLFTALRVHPALGRLFLSGAESTAYPREVVISDALWRRRFGADPHVVGQVARIDGRPETIVGVLPASFRFPGVLPGAVPLPSREPDAYLPVGLEPLNDMDQRGNTNYWVIARLKPGVTIAGAHADLERIASQLSRTWPDDNKNIAIVPVALRDQIVGPTRAPLLLLFGAALVVLLIAGANVSGLLLARALEREREIGIRTALGASTLRIARQLLTESVLLAMLGGGVGLLLTSWGIALLRSAAPNSVPRIEQVDVDVRVLGFALIGALVAGIVFGLAPVLHQRAAGAPAALRDRAGMAGTGASRKLRRVLVSGEVALAVILLTAAGVLLRSFAALDAVPPGFDSHNVMTMFTLLPGSFADTTVVRIEREMLASLDRVPGVDGAAMINTLPLSNLGDNTSAEATDHPLPPSERPSVGFRVIAGPYFHLMRIPLLEGRDFVAGDSAGAPPVAIINQATARRFFPGRDPIGRQITLENDHAPRTIVGVVGDVHAESLDAPATPEVSFPYTQGTDPVLSVAIRTTRDPHALLPAIRRALAAVDPDQAFYAERTMDDLLAASLATRRFSLQLIAGFAALAVILAGVGLYGVIAFSVSQRTREIGIRTALGAERSSIARMVLREGAALAAAGLVAGLVASLAATRLVRSMLFHVHPVDPITFVAVAVGLTAIVLLACYIPARTAARIDPVVALRNE